MSHTVEFDAPGWRLGPKRWDWLRSLRCLLIRHVWTVNPRQTQRVCYRCWTVQDRVTPPGKGGA